MYRTLKLEIKGAVATVALNRPEARNAMSAALMREMIACAGAIATIAVYEEDNLIENARRMGEVMRGLLKDLQDRHPSVGATRNIGLFGIVEVVRNRETREPMAPFNGTSPEMQELGKFFRAEGLYTFVRWNTFFTNPPLCITESELRDGFAIIDRGLALTDEAVAP